MKVLLALTLLSGLLALASASRYAPNELYKLPAKGERRKAQEVKYQESETYEVPEQSYTEQEQKYTEPESDNYDRSEPAETYKEQDIVAAEKNDYVEGAGRSSYARPAEVVYPRSYTYQGKYPGECRADGLYYRDEASFVFCSSRNAYIQPCAPGTRNSDYLSFKAGDSYAYRDFCDVNLVDTGYVSDHKPDPKYQQPYSPPSPRQLRYYRPYPRIYYPYPPLYGPRFYGYPY